MVWAAGVVVAAIVFVTGCSQMGARMDKAASAAGVTLTGAQEVPPVNTRASGVSSIVNATAAHIHMAPAGQNGPVIIPLNKTGDNSYVYVHSAANPGGEIRLQLKP